MQFPALDESISPELQWDEQLANPQPSTSRQSNEDLGLLPANLNTGTPTALDHALAERFLRRPKKDKKSLSPQNRSGVARFLFPGGRSPSNQNLNQDLDSEQDSRELQRLDSNPDRTFDVIPSESSPNDDVTSEKEKRQMD